MKFITRPNGQKHVVITLSDLKESADDLLALERKVLKCADERIKEKEVCEYLVTFSENSAPKWMTIPAIRREVQKQWASRRSRTKIAPEPSIKRRVEKKRSEILNLENCSATYREHLHGYGGQIDEMRRQFYTDRQAFQSLWRHIRCYGDAIASSKFIHQQQNFVLIAMRAITFAKTEEQVSKARDLLPAKYKKYSTEKIISLMEGRQ